MLHVPSELRRTSAAAIGGLLLLTAAAVILAALGFEHIGGYVPCPLCLRQRYAYYGGIPALAAALFLLHTGRTPAAAALFALVAAAFLVNAGFGIHQAGAEWKLWELSSCGPSGALPEFDIDKLDVEKATLCHVPNWRFMGLSFAGWNVVVSAVLAVGAFSATLKTWRRLP